MKIRAFERQRLQTRVKKVQKGEVKKKEKKEGTSSRQENMQKFHPASSCQPYTNPLRVGGN